MKATRGEGDARKNEAVCFVGEILQMLQFWPGALRVAQTPALLGVPMT